MTATNQATLREQVQDFLYREVDLLDRRDFPAWLDLFTEDCVYWVPGGAEELDPTRTVSLVYDTRRTLAERIWRFEGGLAYAQQPRSCTAHTVSNIVVTEVEPAGHPAGDAISVEAKFLISEFRSAELVHHAGRYVYRLVRSPDQQLKIQLKRVELINRDSFLGNLSLPL